VSHGEHIYIEGPAINADAARAALALAADDWRRFLAEQRWYTAKAARPISIRVAHAIPIPWGVGESSFAIAIVDVQLDERTDRYQIAVALRNAAPGDLPPRAIIHRSPAGVLYDAVFDADFRGGLNVALANGATTHDGRGAAWTVEPTVRAAKESAPSSRSSVASGEQSNTSLVFDDSVILKLFRTLKVGVQPDVEVTEFLTAHTSFANTPPLLAVITLEESESDDRATAGMAQRFLPGAVDAWRYALERGREQFAAPADRELPNAFAADARRLGAITRAMHEALAGAADDDPDLAAFVADAATSDDAERWAERARRSVREALSLLAAALGSGAFPTEHTATAQALVQRRAHYLGWIDELLDELGGDLGMIARVHGDYHLGQVLRTQAGDFMVIDFEGEPARPLEERREKTSPLRDVAGMLRSFAYAAVTLATTAGASLDPRTRELRTARWERDVRAAYLAGYLESGEEDDSPIIPENQAHVRQLLTLFETEKAFYELAYELNNRPAWAWIPMRGIAKLFMKR
jgi:trehalose synthase-fused probable maltokinase